MGGLDLEIITPSKDYWGNIEYIAKHMLSDFKAYAQDIVIPSIKRNVSFISTDFSSRRFLENSSDETRIITVPFYTYDKYIHNFQNVRDNIYGLFGDDIIYIREIRNGEYATGKQYQVYLVDVIELSQQGRFSTGKLVFETAEIPYGISIKSSSEIQNNGITTGDSWSYNMGLELVDGKLPVYKKTLKPTESIKILNAGNVPVDAYTSKFWISIKVNLKKGLSNNVRLSLRNQTNDSGLRFDFESDKTRESIFVDGYRFFINDKKYKNIDGNNLVLDKGLNEIQLIDAGNNNENEIESIDITFNFNFLYR